METLYLTEIYHSGVSTMQHDNHISYMSFKHYKMCTTKYVCTSPSSPLRDSLHVASSSNTQLPEAATPYLMDL